MANTTAMAQRREQIARRALQEDTETKTQQMASVETSVGTAMPAAPSSTAWSNAMPSSSRRCVFSMVTVELSTRMPTASARPPRVMVLMVWPSAESTAIEVRIESGIDTMTTRVERHEPRNIRIISAVSAAAIAPSCSTLSMAF